MPLAGIPAISIPAGLAEPRGRRPRAAGRLPDRRARVQRERDARRRVRARDARSASTPRPPGVGMSPRLSARGVPRGGRRRRSTRCRRSSAERLGDVAVIVEDSHPDGIMGIYDPVGDVQRIVIFRDAQPERRGGAADRPPRDRPLLRDGRGAAHRAGLRMSAIGDNWEAVIGLEIHVQLETRTKMFCGCEASFGDEPNIHTCPVCLAPPRDAAGAERAGDPLRADDRRGARLRGRAALDLPPQELLLSRHPEGLPDQPVRQPDRGRGPPRRGAHRARPPRGGHGEDDPRRRVGADPRLERPRWSTSTAPGRRSIEIVTEPDIRSAAAGARLGAAPARRRCARSASPT